MITALLSFVFNSRLPTFFNLFRVAKDLVKCCTGASLARLTTAGIATRTSKPFELEATAWHKHKF